MRFPLNRMPLLLFAIALLAGTSCLGVNVPYPEKRFYSIAAERGDETRVQLADGVLRVRRTRATPENEARAFLRRVEADRFARDYYSEFLVSPADLVGQSARAWLADAHIFEHVVDGQSPASETHILESSLTTLYADESQRDRPRATLEIEFFLFATAGEAPRPILQRSYRREIPIDAAGAAQTVGGWNRALAEILAELEGDIAKAVAAEAQ